MKNRGYSDVLIGLQYGDEGKAKIIDLLAPRYDIVARFNGGANAGHTISTDQGTIALMQIPSAVFYPNIDLYIGSGCVLGLAYFARELDKCSELGFELKGRLFISPQASIVQPHHIVLDALLHKEIGTTGKGIGPCYSDRASRAANGLMRNIRVGALKADPVKYLKFMELNLKEVQDLYGLSSDTGVDELAKIERNIEAIFPFITDNSLYLQKRIETGARVLFEGAQSTMLDVAKGTVPYVTSSHTVAGYAYVGGDVAPKYHRYTFGIAKAIMSRVGNGSFISEYGGKESEEYCYTALSKGINRQTESEFDPIELLGSSDPLDVSKGLRILSGEYGTGTKRPRRVGNLDLVQLEHAVRQNAVDFIFLTKCDLLNNFRYTISGEVAYTSAYLNEKNELVYDFPATEDEAMYLRPEVRGWNVFEENIDEANTFSDLPGQLRFLLSAVEERTGAKVVGVGTGPKRDEIVVDLSMLPA